MFAISARAVRLISLSTVCASFSTIGPSRARAQDHREPRLPGAITAAPSWLKDAPFDVARFFEMPRPEENAAPLYLVAFYEFSPDMELCFRFEDRRDRTEATKARAQRADPVIEAWMKVPSAAGRKEMDAVLAEYAEGLRKLELAQRRPKCVFATGVAPTSTVPHSDGLRRVASVLCLQADRDLDRGDFDHAIGCVEKVLRMSRDVRPRGSTVVQLSSMRIERVFEIRIIPLFLSDSDLEAVHCDHLIALLQNQERMSLDPFITGIKADYVEWMAGLRLFADRVRMGIDSQGRPTEEKLDRAMLIDYLMENNSYARDLINLMEDKPGVAVARRPAVEVLIVRLSAEAPKATQFLNNVAGSFMNHGNSNYGARIAEIKKFEAMHYPPGHAGPVGMPVWARHSLTAYDAMVKIAADAIACRRASQCLLAIRRWQLTQPQVPATDLDAICKAAGMPGVPLDPFSDSPLKMTTDADGIIVYSIGPDGRDDRGLKALEKLFHTSGDILFRMPKIKPRAR